MPRLDPVDLFTPGCAVLLDFDGPVCSVFSGCPAPGIADALRRIITRDGHRLPDDVRATPDPFHVIRRATDIAPGLAPDLEAALTEAELRAVACATPTPGSMALLAACVASGRPVAVVSNNSAEAITAYLDEHDVTDAVRHVQGRAKTDATLMKPHPYPVLQALLALGTDPATDAGSAVLIGDSRADVDAARAAGIHVLAYANKPPKSRLLADADAVITSLEPLAHALTLRLPHEEIPC